MGCSLTHIQDDRDASPGLRGEEVLLRPRSLLPAGGVLPAGDDALVAHLGDDPADEPVEPRGLCAPLRGRGAQAVPPRCGSGLLRVLGWSSELALFLAEQPVDPVPTVARCLLAHPFDGGRSCCAVEEKEKPPPRYITAPAPHTPHPHTHTPTGGAGCSLTSAAHTLLLTVFCEDFHRYNALPSSGWGGGGC